MEKLKVGDRIRVYNINDNNGYMSICFPRGFTFPDEPNNKRWPKLYTDRGVSYPMYCCTDPKECDQVGTFIVKSLK